MQPVRILYVERSPEPSYGGSKRVLVNLVSRLDRGRWAPHVLFYSRGAYVEELRALGIWVSAPDELMDPTFNSERPNPVSLGVRKDDTGSVTRSRVRSLARDLRSEARYTFRDRKVAADLLRFLPDRIDLIHFNGPMQEHYEWVHIARRLKVPFITHEHGIWRRPPSAYRKVARRAAAVLCLTAERAAEVRAFAGSQVHAEVVANGVDLERQRQTRAEGEVRAEFGLREGTALLVTASHIKAWKGQALAVEAAAMLRDAGVPFVWIFCGSQHERGFAEALKARIVELHLEQEVRLLEERSDVPDLFAAADLCVHTSIRPEPFGMVVVEAMCVGTPVVGPAEGAIPDLVRDGTDGFLFQPRDARSLADAVTRALADREALRRMGAVARERALTEFTVLRQVERISAIYERATR